MSNLSPFHQELLSFLSGGLAQAIPENVDETFLAEIVARYHSTFEDQPISTRVELEWMNSFSEKEFISLGLKNYFPRIYRGLPRLYHRDDPCRSRIKKNFSDLASLRNLSIDRALFSLYEGFVPEVGTKVGILSWVMTDGLGDWMAAHEAAHILAARFPEIEIHLFIITQKEQLPVADFKTHVIRYEGEAKNQLLDISFGMDFVLQIPTYFPHSQELFSPMESIGEYGFLESSWFHPKSNNRSMGLHVLEQGIFIRRHKEVAFGQIECKPLLQSLFGTEMPGPVEVSAYKSRFHLAYLATATGGAIYLHSLLKMWERDERNIDVCCPDLSWVIQWIEGRQNLPLLQEPFGVGEMLIEWEGKVHRAQIGQKGKTLRLICPGNLSFADMQRLISLSGDWVGVRGNQSLSEAISAGKAFYYDGRDHSRYLVKDLIALAENRLSGYKHALQAFRMMGQAFLWNLPEDLELWVDETHFQQENKLDWFSIAMELGTSLQDPDTIAGFRKFGLICSEERSVNPFLCHLVQRGLMHRDHPELLQEERRLRKHYGAREISFTLLRNFLVKKIRQIL